jgi:hypothetical protein
MTSLQNYRHGRGSAIDIKIREATTKPESSLFLKHVFMLGVSESQRALGS